MLLSVLASSPPAHLATLTGDRAPQFAGLLLQLAAYGTPRVHQLAMRLVTPVLVTIPLPALDTVYSSVHDQYGPALHSSLGAMTGVRRACSCRAAAPSPLHDL